MKAEHIFFLYILKWNTLCINLIKLEKFDQLDA